MRATALSYTVWPNLNDYILSKGFQLPPSSTAAKGAKDKDGKPNTPTLEQVIAPMCARASIGEGCGTAAKVGQESEAHPAGFGTARTRERRDAPTAFPQCGLRTYP